MPLETVPFDAAHYLDSPDAQAELLMDAFASGDPAYISTALGTIARALSPEHVALPSSLGQLTVAGSYDLFTPQE
jgi:DNA-binding phage protein